MLNQLIRTYVRSIALLLIISMPVIGFSNQTVHVHGVANGSVIIEPTTIAIELRIPAIGVVGFEHIPTTPHEKTLVNQAIQTLLSPQLFQFSSKKMV